MAEVRVRITVPDSWTEDEKYAFAASVKEDQEAFAKKVELMRETICKFETGSIN